MNGSIHRKHQQQNSQSFLQNPSADFNAADDSQKRTLILNELINYLGVNADEECDNNAAFDGAGAPDLNDSIQQSGSSSGSFDFDNCSNDANGNPLQNTLYRRNNYRELCRFDSDKELQSWLKMEGKNWGIVQKGRVTIEDMIDQYACVFKRRKGYSCRASMRVRHSRTTGRKIVEISTIGHKHTYSRELHNLQNAEKAAMREKERENANSRLTTTSSCSDTFDEEKSSQMMMMNDQTGPSWLMNFQQNDKQEHQIHEESEQTHYNEPEESSAAFGTFWSTLLQNAINNNNNNNNSNTNTGTISCFDHQQQGDYNAQQQQSFAGQQQQDFNNDEMFPISSDPFGGFTDGHQPLTDEGLTLNAFSNAVAEKVMGKVSMQFDSKFGEILGAISLVSKSIDEMKRQHQQLTARTLSYFTSYQQRQQNQPNNNEGGCTGAAVIENELFAAAANNKMKGTKAQQEPSQVHTTQSQQRPTYNASGAGNNTQPQLTATRSNGSNGRGRGGSIASSESSLANKSEAGVGIAGFSGVGTNARSISATIRNFRRHCMSNINKDESSSHSNSNIQSNRKRKCNSKTMGKQEDTTSNLTRSKPKVALNFVQKKNSSGKAAVVKKPKPSQKAKNIVEPSSDSAELITSSPQKQHRRRFGFAPYINPSILSSTRSIRKSVQAYRQRRRELSYRHFKEVGMMLNIDGTTKSVFSWEPNEIKSACELKHQEILNVNKKIIYRGHDITQLIYRVDCSRDLVNGRRCGQMIADSLWPKGFFQARMIMPILRGVYHRTKKRVNGQSREPIDQDQFEVFKVALLLLGGFLMSESDRFRWMETAREGVNQRGLDELSNSKRAHFNYEGGPAFSLINADVGTSNRSDEFNFGSNNITDYASAVANLFSGHAHFTFDEFKFEPGNEGDESTLMETTVQNQRWHEEPLDECLLEDEHFSSVTFPMRSSESDAATMGKTNNNMMEMSSSTLFPGEDIDDDNMDAAAVAEAEAEEAGDVWSSHLNLWSASSLGPSSSNSVDGGNGGIFVA